MPRGVLVSDAVVLHVLMYRLCITPVQRAGCQAAKLADGNKGCDLAQVSIHLQGMGATPQLQTLCRQLGSANARPIQHTVWALVTAHAVNAAV